MGFGAPGVNNIIGATYTLQRARKKCTIVRIHAGKPP